MARGKNTLPGKMNGRLSYRLFSYFSLLSSYVSVLSHRLIKGPLLPGWTLTLEVGTQFLRRQAQKAFDLQDINKARQYENSMSFHSPAISKCAVEPVSSSSTVETEPGSEENGQIHGHWFMPVGSEPQAVMLYLHGGGYATYSPFHANLISLVTLAAGIRTFALDYRLAPERPFPSQLDDALVAYKWLLDNNGIAPERLVIAGDSSGGNLALALLLALRNSGLPLPALAVCISPWTDMENSGESMEYNQLYDWPQKRMPIRWAGWFCNGNDPKDPLVSPINADLHGLPPIFIQAGETEILFDMIRQFVENAKSQGADVTLEVWENMNHNFQVYGDRTPQSRVALSHIGQVVRQYALGKTDGIE